MRRVLHALERSKIDSGNGLTCRLSSTTEIAVCRHLVASSEQRRRLAFSSPRRPSRRSSPSPASTSATAQPLLHRHQSNESTHTAQTKSPAGRSTSSATDAREPAPARRNWSSSPQCRATIMAGRVEALARSCGTVRTQRVRLVVHVELRATHRLPQSHATVDWRSTSGRWPFSWAQGVVASRCAWLGPKDGEGRHDGREAKGRGGEARDGRGWLPKAMAAR
ncbi:uncharacterized protein BKA78DRAFT_57815 [Phyllosticta capitalensis]|uniref:uncharacterized protein n=1 Tax=Phyllosticta capitalensis TaxID=121624 RepID=UPI003130A4F7